MKVVCGLLVSLAAVTVAAAAPEGIVHAFEVPQHDKAYTYQTKWFEQPVSYWIYLLHHLLFGGISKRL